MSNIRAIVLDFDGVVVESNEAKMRAFEDLFALYPKHRDAMMKYHLANYSSPRMAKFEHYAFELMGRPNDREAVQIMARRFSESAVRRVTNCPDVQGLQAFLDEFSKRVPLYISSITPQEELRQIVRARGIASYFADVFGYPPVTKAEAIGTVLKREHISPSEMLLVGDSISDYRAAVEAGVEFVGRDSGLSFDGVATELSRDLHGVAGVVRRRIKDQTGVSGIIVYYVVSTVHTRNLGLLASEMPDWTFRAVYDEGNRWLNADHLAERSIASDRG